MSRAIRVALLGVAWSLVPGCYKHVYLNHDLDPGVVETFRTPRTFLLWGAVPLSTPLSLDMCGARGVARIEDMHNFWSLLVSATTGGIVNVTRQKVWCGSKGRLRTEASYASDDAVSDAYEPWPGDMPLAIPAEEQQPADPDGALQ